MQPQTPLVSVCVITYKHASYIAQCLQSIANQQCDFSFEVIVRDDASLDQTFNIAQQLILDKKLKNFSLHRSPQNEGVMPNLLAAIRLCRGNFIAFCEGDDYWIDNKKLQKQVSLMLAHPNCSFSAHPCVLDRGLPDQKQKIFPSHIRSIQPFSFKDVLSVTGQFAPSASYIVTRQALDALPPWIDTAPLGDFFIEMYSLTVGTGLWLPDVMSAYRVFSPGSWSDQFRTDGTRLVRLGEQMWACIQKVEADPRFADAPFAFKKASILLVSACGHLLSHNSPAFQADICKSYRCYPHASATQAALYRLRHTPKIAETLFRAKRALYQLLKVK